MNRPLCFFNNNQYFLQVLIIFYIALVFFRAQITCLFAIK